MEASGCEATRDKYRNDEATPCREATPTKRCNDMHNMSTDLCASALDDVLEESDVSLGDVDFVSGDDLHQAAKSFGTSPTLFAARFGRSMRMQVALFWGGSRSVNDNAES